MRVEVTPRQADVVPGQQLFLSVVITNTTTVIAGFQLRVLGADPGWVDFDGQQISLFPDEVRVLRVAVTPPVGIPAGVRRIAVQVRELTPPQDSSITEIDLAVPPAKSMQVRLDPVAVTAGKRASYSVLAENTGNTRIAGRLAGDDPEGKVAFFFDPELLSLSPGEHAVIDMRARARRHLTGSPTVRQLGIYLDEAPAEAFFEDPDGRAKPARGEEAAVAQAVFIQKSVLSRGALSLVGLLVAVTVFALVITMALGRLVGQTTADRDLALQVAAARNGGAATGTSAVAGTVTLLTSGKPLSAVTVSIFDAADTTKALATTATDSSGSYQIAQLAAGQYKLSFQRAGYVALWYPAATTGADATAVTLKAGEQKHALDIGLGGVPASISGTVTGDDVSASTLYLETVPGGNGASATQTAARSVENLPRLAPGATATPPTVPGALAGGAAIVQKVAVGSDGTFTLSNVPSPNVYLLVVVKTGYATTTQELDVAGGENRTGVVLALRKGDGLITGTVTDSTGLLGGATITATSGQTTATTVSLTDAANRGRFTLQGLPTPGSFTLTATMTGHATQVLTLTLASGQKLTGVQITLGTSAGTLTGVVDEVLPHYASQPATTQPAAGVTVTATDGLLTVQTQTQTGGSIGNWRIAGLPVPGTYTLTFARADLSAQTVSVSLDATGAVPVGSNGTNVDPSGLVHVAMQPATTTITGTVSRACGAACAQPVGEATVTLNSGSTSYVVKTASTPAADLGAFEIDSLPPGTYTLTVSAGSGTGANSQVINLVAGIKQNFPITLNTPASVTGLLKNSAGTPLTGWTVFLYTAAEYPATITASVTTDATGAFRFPAVDAGNYLIALSPTTDPAGSVQTRQFTVQPSQAVDLGTLTVRQ